jgi:hypothetical protein
MPKSYDAGSSRVGEVSELVTMLDENYNKRYDGVWGAHVRPPGVWFR